MFSDGSGTAYSTFYFENDKIVKYEHVVNYGSTELANIAYNSTKDSYAGIKVSVKGTYLILEEAAYEYDDLSKTELEESLKLSGYKINRNDIIFYQERGKI